MSQNAQIKHHIFNESKRALICLPHNARVDAITAALALYSTLKPTHTIALVGDQFQHDPHRFIKQSDLIHSKLPSLQQVVVSIPVAQSGLNSLHYEVVDDMLRIFIEPKRGMLTANEVSAEPHTNLYDTIITLGAQNFESLGSVYTDAPDFFYTTPIINIDFQANNERFGEINHIITTATSVSEVVYQLLSDIRDTNPISADEAHYLLTGILSETNGLKSPRISPPLLQTVSTLVGHGADITAINKQLFHTRSLDMLKLWGRVLARLEEDRELSLVWSLVPYSDFVKTNTNSEEVARIVDDLLQTYSDTKFISLIWEQSNKQIRGLLKSTHEHNALDLTASFNPHGRSDLAFFALPSNSLQEGEQLILETIRKRLLLK